MATTASRAVESWRKPLLVRRVNKATVPRKARHTAIETAGEVRRPRYRSGLQAPHVAHGFGACHQSGRILGPGSQVGHLELRHGELSGKTQMPTAAPAERVRAHPFYSVVPDSKRFTTGWGHMPEWQYETVTGSPEDGRDVLVVVVDPREAPSLSLLSQTSTRMSLREVRSNLPQTRGRWPGRG